MKDFAPIFKLIGLDSEGEPVEQTEEDKAKQAKWEAEQEKARVRARLRARKMRDELKINK